MQPTLNTLFFGYLMAFGAILAWGSYGVPFKKSSTTDPILFQALMALGIFGFTVLATPLLGYSFGFNIYAFASGVAWAIGNIISLAAIRLIGVSRAFPLWVSGIVIMAFLWGVLIFHEFDSGFVGAAIGIICIIVGVIFIGQSSEGSDKANSKGIFLALLSGVIFSSTFPLLKVGTVVPREALFPQALGVFLFAVIFALVKRVKFDMKPLKNSIFSGVLWSVGTILGTIAVAILGVGRGFPITQTAALVSVLWGLFYFKEIHKREDKLKVFGGAVVLLAGVFILALA